MRVDGDGPRVVAIGGGHGQAATLRAARRYAASITAVVSVADDGGSSGRLRRQLGIVPPGDLRMCLVALAKDGSVLAEAFEHRFDGEDLAGHALGNLIIAGLMAAIGEPPEGSRRGRPALRGRRGGSCPATRPEPVVLKAEADAGDVEGQTEVIARLARIRRVFLVLSDPPAARGPRGAARKPSRPGGSSARARCSRACWPPWRVPALAEGIRRSPGRCVYVANLRPEGKLRPGAYDVAAHVAALVAHGVDVRRGAQPTRLGHRPRRALEVPVVEASLAKANGRAHDPARLAAALSRSGRIGRR